MSRRWAILSVVLGLLLVYWGLFGRASDEELIRERLRRLAEAASYTEAPNPLFFKARLNEKLGELLLPGALIEILELGLIAGGLDELSTLGANAGRYAQTLEVSFTGEEIEVEGDRASVQASSALVGMRYGELKRDERAVRFEFIKQSGDWKIANLQVERPAAQR